MSSNLFNFYGKTSQVGNSIILQLTTRNYHSRTDGIKDIPARLSRWNDAQKYKSTHNRGRSQFLKNRKSIKKLKINNPNTNMLQTPKLIQNNNYSNNNLIPYNEPIGHVSRLQNYTGISTKDEPINSTISHLTDEHIFQDNEIVAYTDASYIPGRPAGIGIYFGENHKLNTSCILENVYNSCEAEIKAAEIALLKLAAYGIKENQPIIIRTDFMGIIHSMNNGNNGRFSKDYERLRSLASLFPGGVTFEWIRSHEGEYGNEMADYLAKTATRARSRSHPVKGNSFISSRPRDRSASAVIKERNNNNDKRSLSEKIQDIVEEEKLYKKEAITKNWQ
uniref:ribonuclease H n=1 Tax=Parastrongyloides trichosuri TaxID=131310 RepID=A0A0N4Z667_PARTI